MEDYLKIINLKTGMIFFMIIGVLVMLVFASFSRSAMNRRMMEMNEKIDHMMHNHKSIPATYYDNSSKRCILVYPDSIRYGKPYKTKGE